MQREATLRCDRQTEARGTFGSVHGRRTAVCLSVSVNPVSGGICCHGQLCKTYPWPDTKTLPGGLPLCSDATCPTVASLTGATTAYLGFTYTFNGSKWVRGSKAQSYNPKTQDMDPWSADQYDPLGLYSKEEKAKHPLTKPEIQAVADKFDVTYQEALQDAKNQGYQVPK
jgi:hypothetical protein